MMFMHSLFLHNYVTTSSILSARYAFTVLSCNYKFPYMTFIYNVFLRRRLVAV